MDVDTAVDPPRGPLVRTGRRAVDAADDLRIRQNLLALRARSGLSLTQAGAAFGVSMQAVWKWETGRSRPALALAPAICTVYRCTLDELFRGCRR